MSSSSPESPTRRQFLQVIIGGATLAACTQEMDERQSLLASLGIQGPAMLYVAYQGCIDNGPHNVPNLHRLAANVKVPIYVIDIGVQVPLKDETGRPYDVTATPIRTKDGRELPGKTILVGPNVLDVVKKLGFPMLGTELSGHSGKVQLLNEHNEVVASGLSKDEPNGLIQKFKSAIPQPSAPSR